MAIKKTFFILVFFIFKLSLTLFAQTDSIISDQELMNQVEQARAKQGKLFSKEWLDTVPNIVENKNLRENSNDSLADPLSQLFKNPSFKSGLPKVFMFGDDTDSLMRKMQEGMKNLDFGGNSGGQNFFNFGKSFDSSDSTQQNFQGFSFDGKNLKPFGNMDTTMLNQFKKQMENFSLNFGKGMQDFQFPDNLMKQLQNGMDGFPNNKDLKQFGQQKQSQSDKQNSKKKGYSTESF